MFFSYDRSRRFWAPRHFGTLDHVAMSTEVAWNLAESENAPVRKEGNYKNLSDSIKSRNYSPRMVDEARLKRFESDVVWIYEIRVDASPSVISTFE